jgi:hypothetical protein
MGISIHYFLSPFDSQWNISMYVRLSHLSLLLVTLTACLCIGCSKDDSVNLTLVPVKGKLTERGGKAVSGGTLDFRPVGETFQGAATAEVADDGSFTVRTISKQKKLDGMAPGHYAVTYLPKQAADQLGEPFEFEGILTVPDAGFPDANPLKLEMPARKR